MPPVTPDPAAGPLAGFTPAAVLDPADILFRAGRASARTPWGWKAAVAGLTLSNLAVVGALVLRQPEDVAVSVVAPTPPPAEAAPVEPPAEPSPPSGLLARSTDLGAWPRPPADFDHPPDYPLTLAEARRAAVE